MNRTENLFTQPKPLAPKPTDSIQVRFEHYHFTHPEVWQLFKQLAAKAMVRGKKKFSARAILHLIRWEFEIEQGNAAFKVNDHYSSRCGRKLMQEDARFKDFFELRPLGGER